VKFLSTWVKKNDEINEKCILFVFPIIMILILILSLILITIMITIMIIIIIITIIIITHGWLRNTG